MIEMDDPVVRAEVNAAFDAYEKALVGNDIAALNRWFWDDERTLRYGASENLTGHAQIAQFRAARPSAGLAREVLQRHVVTFGKQYAVANIVFRRSGEPRIGRQSQSWVRFSDGWKVVAAHVSWMDA